MANKYITENDKVGGIVRDLETSFISGSGTLMSKYVVSDLYTDISKIYAYLNSKHTSGEKDSKGRDKPFFNIVNAARNIYYRATDIDRKNIQVNPTNSKQVVPAFVAMVLLKNWMRKENFGKFLNDWGLELAAFNSSVVKFIETSGKLIPTVVPWSRLIVDQINFDANPKIEVLEMTEAELQGRVRTHGYSAEMVEKLCDAVSARTLVDGEQQDQKTGYVKLYEVHANWPLSYLTGSEKDEDTYTQQMHVVSYVVSKEKGEFDDFTLASGREARDPYMLTALLPATDGSVSLDGAVKNLFNAQWMMNHTAKSIKDQMDIASKLMFQTADPNFAGRNALTAIEQGDILIHSTNNPVTQVQNNSHDITIQQGMMNMWKSLSSEINGVSESMLGNTPPSGTAWRQVNALLQESHSLFELMTENKGLYIEQMLREFVIPHIMKKMDTKEEISAILEDYNIAKIDSMYVPAEAIKRFNQDAVKKVLALDPNKPLADQSVPSPYQPDAAQAAVKNELGVLGNQRFFTPDEIGTKTWKDVLKDFEWDVEIDITGEAVDKRAVLDTLSTALTVVSNPGYSQNPQAQLIVSKIMSATGVISPIEMGQMTPPPTPVPATPVAAPPAPALPTATSS